MVVIGAGAAGLAATRGLLRQGVSVITVEASGRIGGRAHTDRDIFGVPYDIGAHWLHHSSTNAFVQYGIEHDFTVYAAPNKQSLYVGNRKATAEQYAAYTTAYRNAVRAISSAGRKGRDVSPASVVPDAREWHDLVHFVIGPWEMGKDFDAFSCKDWWNSEDGTDWFCQQGYGALLAHSARDLDVQLSTKVNTINWGNKGVLVETAKGTIRSRACIVTVSTGVLANEDIRFVPKLPDRKVESFHGISMGLYNHIALFLDQNIAGTGADEYLIYNADSHGAHSPSLMGLLTNVSGTRLSLADVGGDFAMELEVAGQAAAIDFARSELRKLFGADVEKHFVKAHFTRWGHNRLTRGSYASARPGAFPLRSVLRESVGDRIWFAGEACSIDKWATVAGAHESGLQVSKQVAKALAES